MKRLIAQGFVFLLGFVFALGLHRSVSGANSQDRLVPVEASREEGSGGVYRRLYETKLFVTAGDVARYVYLPGGRGEESAVSVYRCNNNGGIDTEYCITFTRASTSLWHCVSRDDNKAPKSPAEVRIIRYDARIPGSIAKAVHEVWLAALKTTAAMPADRVTVEGSTQIFSAEDRGVMIRARTDNLDGDTWKLISLAESLGQYAVLPPARQRATGRRIERDALDLLDRLKHRK